MADWLGRIPPLVKLLLWVGGGLMSAFSSVLPAGWQNFGLAAGIIIALFGFFGLAIHVIKELRQKKRLGPTSVIIVGLVGTVVSVAITAAGVIWLQTSSQATNSQTRGEVRPQAVSRAPIVGQTSNISKYYSAADRERIADVLFRIEQLLTTKGERAAAIGRSAPMYLQKFQFNNLDPLSQLGPAREPTLSLGDELWSGLPKEFASYREDILRVLGARAPYDRFRNALISTINAWKALAEISSSKEPLIRRKAAVAAGPAAQSLSEAGEAFQDWIVQCRARVHDMRRDLSSAG